MTRIQTGRAIVHFPYESTSTGKTYHSILLGLEKQSDRYSLPGGNKEGRESTADTAIRELLEEFGLYGSNPRFVFSRQGTVSYNGKYFDHDVYVVDATGTIDLDQRKRTGDRSELKAIGFFNAGRHNQIPSKKLAGHVEALVPEYFQSGKVREKKSKITVPDNLMDQWRKRNGVYRR